MKQVRSRKLLNRLKSTAFLLYLCYFAIHIPQIKHILLGAKPLLMLKFIYPKPLQDKIVQDFKIFERKIRHLELINQNVL